MKKFSVEESVKLADQMEKNEEFFEDTDILFNEEIERDVLDMIKDDMPKEMFVTSCLNMMGGDWLDVVEQLLENNPVMMEKFKRKYANEETA